MYKINSTVGLNASSKLRAATSRTPMRLLQTLRLQTQPTEVHENRPTRMVAPTLRRDYDTYCEVGHQQQTNVGQKSSRDFRRSCICFAFSSLSQSQLLLAIDGCVAELRRRRGPGSQVEVGNMVCTEECDSQLKWKGSRWVKATATVIYLRIGCEIYLDYKVAVATFFAFARLVSR